MCFTDTTHYGGAEQAMLILLAGLDRHRWQPTLAYHPAPELSPLEARARQLGVELWPVPPMPDGWVGARRAPQFARALRARQPDVFHAHLTWPLACKFGLASAILAGLPAIVATVHLFVEFRMDASICLQQRLIAARLGRYLAVSEHVKRRLVQALPWPADKIKVIHNGIDCRVFGRSAAPALRTASDARPIVFTPARLDPQKGQGYLLQAAAQVPQARFVLAGEGPERASLEAQARQLGLEERVSFLGYRADVPDLLAGCDLFVLPSLYEGLPLVVLEAMAAGKPVLATAVGGTDEAVIHGQTGWLVPPADPAALAWAIRLLLSDSALARRLALAGQAQVQREFSADLMVRQVTQAYEQLLAPGAG
jgi:glycosyltransferase involved in cell wall biosynthesis